jgi:hypothetical protein
MCLGLTKFGFGQTNSETKIIVQISPVYRSGSVGYIPDSYLMVSNSFGEAFQTDLYFTLMSKKKFRQQSDLIDSISKDFKIYLIGFDSTQKQIKEVFTDKNNFGKSFDTTCTRSHGRKSLFDYGIYKTNKTIGLSNRKG